LRLTASTFVSLPIVIIIYPISLAITTVMHNYYLQTLTNVYKCLYTSIMYDIDISSYKIDHYCKIAREFTGHDGLCTECPFRDCLDDLKPLEKRMILQSDTIKQAYTNYDQCADIRQVAMLSHTTYHRVYQWLCNRDRIEAKFNAYLPA